MDFFLSRMKKLIAELVTMTMGWSIIMRETWEWNCEDATELHLKYMNF